MLVRAVLLMAAASLSPLALAQQANFQSFKLDDLSEFKPQAGNWHVVSDVLIDPESDAWHAASKKSRAAKPGALPPMPKGIALRPGAGVLFNINDARRKDHLLSALEHGDIELELEIMVPRGSNSGVYLQGRYEVQVFDSDVAKLRPSFGEMGGIYRNWETEQGKIYRGKAPLLDAAKGPGLWQQYRISFRAPKFDAAGRKIANARFVYVDLNGVRIHDNVEVPLPTGGPIENNERAKGPIMIQGDHGPVALRNIRYRVPVDSPAAAPKDVSDLDWVPPGPVYVDVVDVPRLHRSFFDYQGSDAPQKLAHAISVGDPRGVNYVYDMSAGNLVALWRGPFIDASQMWIDRGNGFSTPRGAVQLLFNNQPLAFLASADEAFPVITNDIQQLKPGYQARGYRLDEQGRPVFRYDYQGLEIEDRLIPSTDGKRLTHTIQVKQRGERPGLHYKLGQGREILAVKPGWFVIDRQYYIHVASAKPRIRTLGERQELVVPLGDSLEYSILW